jgi:hypothetical protein
VSDLTKSQTAKLIWGTVAVIALLAVLAVGVWQLGWFVEEENVEQRTRIDNTRTGVQRPIMEEARRTVGDIAVTSEDNTAARNALTRQACELIARLTDEFREQADDLVAFEKENCQ